MKPRLVAVASLVLLLFLVGCLQLEQQKLHPPAWIHGEWGIGSDPDAFSFMFSEQTVLQRVGATTLDLGEMYRVSKTLVTETITDTLYAWRIPMETGWMKMKFEKIDANTIGWTMETNISTTGPTPLQRL
jgi:hypothetical protein